jgi:hypothetical protein
MSHFTNLRIRIQQLKLMRIHADTDPDPKPCFDLLMVWRLNLRDRYFTHMIEGVVTLTFDPHDGGNCYSILTFNPHDGRNSYTDLWPKRWWKPLLWPLTHMMVEKLLHWPLSHDDWSCYIDHWPTDGESYDTDHWPKWWQDCSTDLLSPVVAVTQTLTTHDDGSCYIDIWSKWSCDTDPWPMWSLKAEIPYWPLTHMIVGAVTLTLDPCDL